MVIKDKKKKMILFVLLCLNKFGLTLGLYFRFVVLLSCGETYFVERGVC